MNRDFATISLFVEALLGYDSIKEVVAILINWYTYTSIVKISHSTSKHAIIKV